MKKVTARDFRVDYYEKEKDVWIVESHLVDEPHDISVIVEVDMAQMVINDAKIKFTRFPVEHCPAIEKKSGQLKGLKIDDQFSRNAMKIFMGSEGCPNVMMLLSISLPGIIYYYYPHKIKSGEMTEEQFDKIIRTELKDACLAHAMLS